jgi:hypothetical protein
MNGIFIHYGFSKIFEVFHILKGIIINLYIVTSSHIPISRHDHVLSILSIYL